MNIEVKTHLEIRKPSIKRIATLCSECLEHDSTWWEFRERCRILINKETDIIRMLEKGRKA